MPAKKKEPKVEEPVFVDEQGRFIHEHEGAQYQGGIRRYLSGAAASAAQEGHAQPAKPAKGAGGKHDAEAEKDDAATGDGCVAVYRHGKGTYISPALSYTGDWVEDVMEGDGTLRFVRTQCSYTGQFKQGKFDGHGVYVWADGSSYDGQWRGNRIHGEGVHTDVHGTVRKGQYFNGTGPGLDKVYHAAALAATEAAAPTATVSGR